MNMSDFVKERNEALLSLDKDKIIKYMKKYNVKIAENELVFWAGVHKAIMYINSATEEQKNKSAEWLIENGFNPIITRFGSVKNEKI